MSASQGIRGESSIRLKQVVPESEWPATAALITQINRLKRTLNAVVLAHNYQTPAIFHGVADIVGDSLQLARQATLVDARIIVQAGVYFMAETSKIMSPGKTVLIPDLRAGCSLASSITAADVRRLRRQHPGLPVVSYVNTSAEVKAESDVCCTSSNAVAVVEAAAAEWGVGAVIFVPDRFLAQNVARRTCIRIIPWHGRCEVHERFSPEEIRRVRALNPDTVVLAHPECPPDVVAESDFTGSTSAMIEYVTRKRPARVVMLTECSMADNIAGEAPEVEFLRPCHICPHMKRITLEGILRSLRTMQHEVKVDREVAQRAKVAIDRMLAVSAQAVP